MMKRNALLYLGLFFCFCDGLVAAEPRKVVVPVGLSRIVEAPFEIISISLEDRAGILNFQRIKEGKQERKILLVPLGVGVTRMKVRDATGEGRLDLEIEAVSDPDAVRAVLPELKHEAEGRGAEVREVQLNLGTSEELSFSYPVGPIYLTDSQKMSFVRLAGGELKIIGRKSGLTDLTIHDANGAPRLFVLVTVR